MSFSFFPHLRRVVETAKCIHNNIPFEIFMEYCSIKILFKSSLPKYLAANYYVSYIPNLRYISIELIAQLTIFSPLI